MTGTRNLFFKHFVKQDLDVFINPDEFADIEHDLNGTRCKAIIQSPTDQERFIDGLQYSQYDGIHGVETIVHVRKDALPEAPVEGQVFMLDGKVFRVTECIDDMGILSIKLQGEMIHYD